MRRWTQELAAALNNGEEIEDRAARRQAALANEQAVQSQVEERVATYDWTQCQNRHFAILASRRAPIRGAQRKNTYQEAIEPCEAEGRGYGVRAVRAFKAGQIIAEYTGEIISPQEAERRVREEYKDHKHYYMMSINKHFIIDGFRGSVCRFVNHSCSPNCRVEEWTVNDEPRIALFAGDRNIAAGTELTYDYNYAPYGEPQICLCGAKKCRGSIGPTSGKRPENVAETAANTARNVAKSAVRSTSNVLNAAKSFAKRKLSQISTSKTVEPKSPSKGRSTKTALKAAQALKQKPERPIKRRKLNIIQKVTTTTRKRRAPESDDESEVPAKRARTNRSRIAAPSTSESSEAEVPAKRRSDRKSTSSLKRAVSMTPKTKRFMSATKSASLLKASTINHTNRRATTSVLPAPTKTSDILAPQPARVKKTYRKSTSALQKRKPKGILRPSILNKKIPTRSEESPKTTPQAKRTLARTSLNHVSVPDSDAADESSEEETPRVARKSSRAIKPSPKIMDNDITRESLRRVYGQFDVPDTEDEAEVISRRVSSNRRN